MGTKYKFPLGAEAEMIEIFGPCAYERDENSETEINRELAVRLFDWKRGDTPFPSYTASWDGAAMVIKAMETHGWQCSIDGPSMLVGDYDEKWCAGFRKNGIRTSDFGEDFPRAICMAARKALRRSCED